MMQQLQKKVKKEVMDHILPFWMQLKDEKYGGFYGMVNYDLQIDKNSVKGGIATARLLWSFSAAYRVLKKTVYLDLAKHAYQFLTEKIYDKEYGGLYWMVDHQGEPVDTRKHIYAQSFGIYGLSEYYRVTKDLKALALAKKLYLIIEKQGYDFKNNAYLEEFTRKWDFKPNEMLSENNVLADLTMNTHLHVLEAYTNLYRVWPEESLRVCIIRLLKIFINQIYNPKIKHLQVFFDSQWNSLIDLQSYGHDIEASWLIDEAMQVIGWEHSDFLDMIKEIADCIITCAVMEDGSLINEKEGDQIDFTRIWWVQSEALVGFLNIYERTGQQRFFCHVQRLWDYIEKNFIDQRKGGEWFWSIEADGRPTPRAIVEPWKTPYHNTRACLELIERLEK